MNEIEVIRQFGARSEPTASMSVDVTARVLRTIQCGRVRRWPDSVQPLATVLAASWVTVVLTGYFVLEVWWELQDPLNSLITPFVVSLQ